ncbi:heme exporter protein CcmD [Catenovulum sediminis]|uniref:Heme exporter protein D n=1 Tax=Catenovulum sediminis TaxID=1740262 RepID=A0ABV1RKN4_9ALTE|nr:heme exporter protein CcmD [Catenovulum sediminis]
MGVFESFSQFLDMRGYAFYVWTSYGLSVAVVVLLFIWSKSQRNSLIEEIKQQDEVRKVRKNQSSSEMRL